jgi:hypothetical protein
MLYQERGVYQLTIHFARQCGACQTGTDTGGNFRNSYSILIAAL